MQEGKSGENGATKYDVPLSSKLAGAAPEILPAAQIRAGAEVVVRPDKMKSWFTLLGLLAKGFVGCVEGSNVADHVALGWPRIPGIE